MDNNTNDGATTGTKARAYARASPNVVPPLHDLNHEVLLT